MNPVYIVTLACLMDDEILGAYDSLEEATKHAEKVRKSGGPKTVMSTPVGVAVYKAAGKKVTRLSWDDLEDSDEAPNDYRIKPARRGKKR